MFGRGGAACVMCSRGPLDGLGGEVAAGAGARTGWGKGRGPGRAERAPRRWEGGVG